MWHVQFNPVHGSISHRQDMIAVVALEHFILDHPFLYIVLDGLGNLKATDLERARPLPLNINDPDATLCLKFVIHIGDNMGWSISSRNPLNMAGNTLRVSSAQCVGWEHDKSIAEETGHVAPVDTVLDALFSPPLHCAASATAILQTDDSSLIHGARWMDGICCSRPSCARRIEWIVSWLVEQRTPG